MARPHARLHAKVMFSSSRPSAVTRTAANPMPRQAKRSVAGPGSASAPMARAGWSGQTESASVPSDWPEASGRAVRAHAWRAGPPRSWSSGASVAAPCGGWPLRDRSAATEGDGVAVELLTAWRWPSGGRPSSYWYAHPERTLSAPAANAAASAAGARCRRAVIRGLGVMYSSVVLEDPEGQGPDEQGPGGQGAPEERRLDSCG